ncbi:hypothetical protein [Amycolatopsis sp. CA-128772]|uniref:hypothetical protein n=1 Tax=Amycolatopsis sp. CA-128772 TaxID=2073159 RepID=UPI000CD21537|nr:hypothetical protein [Amycolatopsis sp. CA-128772]
MPVWVTIITAVLGSTVLSAVVSSVVTYRLKGREEARLGASAELERQLRTAELFVKLMDRANARGEAVLVEPVAEAVASHPGFAQALAGGDLERVKALAKVAVVNGPVGGAAQIAAAELVASLADRHEQLRSAARLGLAEVGESVPEVDVRGWGARWDAAGR